MKKTLTLLALAVGASTCIITAQDKNPPAGGPPGDGPRPPGGGGPGGQGGPRPPNPIIEALDLNKDGVIDADEIAKATESLKKLDKNGDGKLTEEEFRPLRPGGPGGGGGRPDGQSGAGANPDGRGPGRSGAPGAGPQTAPAPGGEGRPQRPPLEK